MLITDEQDDKDTTQDDSTEDKTQDEDKIVLDDLFPQDKGGKDSDSATTHTKGSDNTDKSTKEDEAAKEARLLSKVQETVRTTIAESTKEVDRRASREREITRFLTSDDGKDYSQYTEQITKVATDPRYSDLSLDRIVGMALTPKVLIKIGARKGKEAKEESAATETGGSSGGEMPTKDVWDVPSADFERMKQEALSGKYLKK